jgi:hypothetical protein
MVKRPHAAMRASTYCSTGFNVLNGKLDIAPDRAKENPFIDVVTAASLEATIVNVLSLGRSATETKKATFSGDAGQLEVAIGKSSVRITPKSCVLL